MKIAIHNTSGSFSDRWIEYCLKNHIVFKEVNCYRSDIIEQLKGCSGLMWHWDLNDYRDMLFAKQLTMALSNLNVKIFPDVHTSWHFDDKIGQKYLLEAINAPLVPSTIFYSKKEAIEWARNTNYPKVFKLRGGAASINVRLVKNYRQAQSLINKTFGKGFKPINRWTILSDKIYKFKRYKNLSTLIGIFKSIGRFLLPTELERMSARQKGYIYFQEFIPNNEYDTRIYIVGKKCFGSRRFNRKNDFRASGSGEFSYDADNINLNCVKLAYKISHKLKTQSLAFDFLKDENEFKLIEISYCFPAYELYDMPGYWDENLKWHQKEIIPEYFMIEDFIKSIRNDSRQH